MFKKTFFYLLLILLIKKPIKNPPIIFPSVTKNKLFNIPSIVIDDVCKFLSADRAANR